MRFTVRACSSGFSFAELLIALAVSSLTVAAALHLLQSGSRVYRSAEYAAALRERAAFAFAAVQADVEHAGAFGLHRDGLRIAIDPALRVQCARRDVRAWALALHVPVAGARDGLDPPCPPASSHLPGNDALTLRYAAATDVPPSAGRLQLTTNPESGALFDDGTPPALPPPSVVRDLEVRSYYVDRRSSEAGLPALRRYTLVRNNLLQNQEIMPGVEGFRVQLGVDRDGDGTVDSFVAPDAAAGARVFAVRVALCIRGDRRAPATAAPGRCDFESERVFALNNAPP